MIISGSTAVRRNGLYRAAETPLCDAGGPSIDAGSDTPNTDASRARTPVGSWARWLVVTTGRGVSATTRRGNPLPPAGGSSTPRRGTRPAVRRPSLSCFRAYTPAATGIREVSGHRGEDHRQAVCALRRILVLTRPFPTLCITRGDCVACGGLNATAVTCESAVRADGSMSDPTRRDQWSSPKMPTHPSATPAPAPAPPNPKSRSRQRPDYPSGRRRGRQGESVSLQPCMPSIRRRRPQRFTVAGDEVRVTSPRVTMTPHSEGPVKAVTYSAQVTA